ncbi:hypothetical protein VTJ04DRAFT_9321 [Mycothermus thermophilus]|uniref:uncharacterized protein n=1 Tax=Humicola insolens TaxID=85995 RepID=UPI003743F7B1
MALPSSMKAMSRPLISSSFASSCRLTLHRTCSNTRPTTPRISRTSTPSTPKRFFTQQHLSRPLQIYHSASTDPYINLSIEHHLLQRSPPDSTILFLYTNRPCIVIGRNQNPWLEVNLLALADGLPSSSPNVPPSVSPISLVRRRSGGGAVFHDLGNANWSVICPPAIFTRDRHADMVAKALRERLGVPTAHVNGRHDIVIDDDADTHESSEKRTFKISGSAYKLTRTRALHHGTCLLSSPHLARIGRLLRSPAEGFLKARGVESVRSPIRNVGVDGEEFAQAVLAEFRAMYGGGGSGSGDSQAEEVVVVTEEEALANDNIVAGVRELANAEWIFGQTPLFTFSTYPTEEDPRERTLVGHKLPQGFRAHLVARHGEIQSATINGVADTQAGEEESDEALSTALVNRRLHHITDWQRLLQEASPTPVSPSIGNFLNDMFGIRPSPDGKGGSVAEMIEQTIAETPLGRFLSQTKNGD